MKTTRKGQRKQVRAYTSGPFSVCGRSQVAWEDIHFRYKRRPGQPLVRDGVTICGYAELISEIAFSRDLARDYPEDADTYNGEAEEYEEIKAALESAPYAILGRRPDCVEVFTRAHYINREDAEGACAFYLEQTAGIKNPKFRWVKPRVFCMPMGALHPAARGLAAEDSAEPPPEADEG